ncbi:hypothetical protein QZH41_006449 [Actinostola sp. cb2023]|nr:hypothetical protein QZH41_006449 [Actinostola sp. cb2023]
MKRWDRLGKREGFCPHAVRVDKREVTGKRAKTLGKEGTPPTFRAKLFPVCCGHRKPIFTGTSSIPLRTILLSIDSGLPSLAEIQQLKNKVLLFLNAVEEELQKKTITTTFECIFAGSIEERYGVPYNYKKDFPSQLDALYSDFDVMFCCESFNASFTRQGNILVEHLGIDENLILAGYALLKGVVPAGSQNLLLDSYEPLKRIREAVRSSKASNLPVNAFWGLFGTPPIAAAIKGPSVKAKLFPVSCGHRKLIFTGTSSIPLRTILLSIDSGLPSLAEIQQLKNEVLPFLDAVKEELQKRITTTTFECIFAGSIEERYGVPYQHYKEDFPSQLGALYTDFDVMFCCESFHASFTRQGNILVKHLGIDGNVILPEYVLLKTLVHGSQNLCLDSYEFLRKVREAVRSSKVSNLPVNAIWKFVGTPIVVDIRGPAVKVKVNPSENKKYLEGDITLCVKCLEWPSLSDWPTRKNRLWPSLEDVRRITLHGCHLVAKPLNSNNGDRLPYWRFSFSVAEVELSKLVPDTARRCFMALKVILKDHLQPVVPDLSSYHIKTIFLNTLEKKPENFWVDENIEECFQTLLKELHDALESKTCQHHWLKQVNLFGHIAETNRKRFSILVQKLEKIQEDPAPFIYDDGRCCVCPCLTSVRKKPVARVRDSRGPDCC